MILVWFLVFLSFLVDLIFGKGGLVVIIVEVIFFFCFCLGLLICLSNLVMGLRFCLLGLFLYSKVFKYWVIIFLLVNKCLFIINFV